MLELELTRARLPTLPAKAGAGEATTTAAAASWSCLNGNGDHQTTPHLHNTSRDLSLYIEYSSVEDPASL